MGQWLCVGLTGAPEHSLIGMTQRVAEEETQEGSQSGIWREHELPVEHPECEVPETCPLGVFAD